MGFGFPDTVVWQPSQDVIERSRIVAFMRRHGLRDLAHLHARSITDLEWFWSAVLEDLDIQFYTPYTRVLDTSPGVPWTRWCVDGSLNIVHNCLDKWMSTGVADRVALRWESEAGRTGALTYRALNHDVCRCAAGLQRLGVRPGDRVALFMPMIPELVVAFLAVIKVGAVIVPLFSGYGADAVATRLQDADATVLFTVDGVQRRGRPIAMKAVADAAADRAPSLAHLVMVRHLGSDVTWREGRDLTWETLMGDTGQDCDTVRTAAEDPLMVIYTSGTTGRPKGAVHSHCGFPVKATQDLVHGFDMRCTDTLYWVTDMGWMMGPWEVFGTLLLGATMVLYDGAPDYPTPDRLWSLLQNHNVSIVGVSPTLIRSLMAHQAAPRSDAQLTSLRMFGSTGEPWDAESWHWLFATAGHGRYPIINYSGGTEVSGGLLVGNLVTPLKPCAFAGPPPGIAADVVDAAGRSIRGDVGELVVRQPWIGMTRGFWKDPDRYVETYWSRFPGTWTHGDWAGIDTDGSWYVLGRSDDTIKVAGKRLGPAEVESILTEHHAVMEAAAIGVPDETKGQALVCFCVLVPDAPADTALATALGDVVAERMGKPLRPKRIEFVHALPKTRNGKIMRRVIRSAYLDAASGDLTALENPDALEAIRAIGKHRRG